MPTLDGVAVIVLGGAVGPAGALEGPVGEGRTVAHVAGRRGARVELAAVQAGVSRSAFNGDVKAEPSLVPREEEN